MKKGIIFQDSCCSFCSSAWPAPPAPRNPSPTPARSAGLSVSEIRDKTAAGGLSAQIMEKYHMPWKEIGEGMRDMLTTALFKTKRFAVLERAILDEVMKEQDLAASGRVQQGTGAATGGIVRGRPHRRRRRDRVRDGCSDRQGRDRGVGHRHRRLDDQGLRHSGHPRHRRQNFRDRRGHEGQRTDVRLRPRSDARRGQ